MRKRIYDVDDAREIILCNVQMVRCHLADAKYGKSNWIDAIELLTTTPRTRVTQRASYCRCRHLNNNKFDGNFIGGRQYIRRTSTKISSAMNCRHGLYRQIRLPLAMRTGASVWHIDTDVRWRRNLLDQIQIFCRTFSASNWVVLVTKPASVVIRNISNENNDNGDETGKTKTVDIFFATLNQRCRCCRWCRGVSPTVNWTHTQRTHTVFANSLQHKIDKHTYLCPNKNRMRKNSPHNSHTYYRLRKATEFIQRWRVVEITETEWEGGRETEERKGRTSLYTIVHCNKNLVARVDSSRVSACFAEWKRKTTAHESNE